jgi:hypothetical protein
MALRTLALLVVLGCGGPSAVDADEPQTAKEKQELEASESDDPKSTPNKWGGWKYKGARDDCYFVVGRTCFKTEKEACTAARCRSPKKCEVVGGGPATVSCK